MKIALFSVDGYGFPVAYHLQSEGHEVYVGQVQDWARVQVKVNEKEKERRKRLTLYDGMFDNKWTADKLLSFLVGQPSGRRGDWFIICDFNWLWPYADRLRSSGFRGLLPHREDYQLEHDRKATRDLIEELYPDVETGDYKEFKKSKDGIAYLEKNEGKLYVLKGFNSDAETIVPDSDDPDINGEIITDALEHDEEHNYEKDGFILEEKIPDVIEFTPEAIAWDGQVRCVSVDVEHKRFGSRSGPQVGCASNVVVWQNDNDQIYRMFLEPLESRMLRRKELTIWDLSVLYSPSMKKYYAGEFCPNRMGFDAVFSEIDSFGSATNWLEHIMGDDKEYEPIGVAIRMFNPNKANAIFIGDPAAPNVWCYDIHCEDDKYHTTGIGKDVCVLTESGPTIEKAIEELYKVEHDVEFDPGYHLEEHDWYDKEWPINVLHRIEVLEKLGLIEGGEKYATKKGTKKGMEKGRGNGDGTTEEISAATESTGFGRGNASIRGYA
jgi:hypothetical protein